MPGPVFVCGPLCHRPLLQLVLGGGQGGKWPQAELPGHALHFTGCGQAPELTRSPGRAVRGLVLDLPDPGQRARLGFYATVLGMQAQPAQVVERGRTRKVTLLARAPADGGDRAPWSLARWQRDCWPGHSFAAEETMGYFGRLDAAEVARRWPMIRARAGCRLRGRSEVVPTELRSDWGPEAVRVARHAQPYAGFFTFEEDALAFRRFDGAMSATVERSGFVGGDAAIVLPYDPASDRVMLIEQFRYGPFLRRDRRPWTLEPIAGRIDADESPEACARREAMEEAGLQIDRLEPVANYYPSPGADSEYFYTFIGLTRLRRAMQGVGGVAQEAEDIKSHVIGFSRLMELVSSGEANCGPLLVLAWWLAVNRPRLRRHA